MTSIRLVIALTLIVGCKTDKTSATKGSGAEGSSVIIPAPPATGSSVGSAAPAAPVAAGGFTAEDVAKLATGSVLAYDGTNHFAYLARANGSEAWVALESYEVADAKGEKPARPFKVEVPMDKAAPPDIAAIVKPQEAKLLAALAGYRPIPGVAVDKSAKLSNGDTMSFEAGTLTFTPVGGKPVSRKLDGGGVTTPAASYAFALGDAAGTVIVTTSYKGDEVFTMGFEKFAKP